MEVNSQFHSPATYLRGRATGTHWIGGGASPRVGLITMEKRKISCRCRESNPASLVVEPIAHSCAGWAISAPQITDICELNVWLICLFRILTLTWYRKLISPYKIIKKCSDLNFLKKKPVKCRTKDRAQIEDSVEALTQRLDDGEKIILGRKIEMLWHDQVLAPWG
jgi:hypothetical protein